MGADDGKRAERVAAAEAAWREVSTRAAQAVEVARSAEATRQAATIEVERLEATARAAADAWRAAVARLQALSKAASQTATQAKAILGEAEGPRMTSNTESISSGRSPILTLRNPSKPP